MVAGSTNEAINKYRIGCKVLEVQSDKGKYGENSVGHIAHELGCTAALLYSYATVSKTWTDSALRTLLKKKNARGLPLSFSHLVELAKAKNDEQRRKLTGRAVKEAWSVRAIAAKVPQPKATTTPRAPAAIAQTIATSSASAVESVREHLAASLRINKEAMENSGIRKKLQTARADVRKAMALSEKLETKLTRLLDSGAETQGKAA